MAEFTSRLIGERVCPRCDRVRTVRFGPADNCACLHCGHSWTHATAEANETEEPLDVRLDALFSPSGLERLKHFRAAVRIGFYNEWHC